MEKEILITADISGNRIDNYLHKKFDNYSRGYFQKLIKLGNVTVNTKTVVSHYAVKEGDEIIVKFLLNEVKDITEENIPFNIIYEDNDLLVINKDAGIVVHPACGHFSGTLLNAVAGYAKGTFIPLLVHRLDKDTSGVIIIAKNERSKNSLVKQFQNKGVSKTYLTAVKGSVNENKGHIDAPLGRSPEDRKKIVVGPLAKKAAVTEFLVCVRHREYSILEVHPLTGRTHQIRSHMAYIGHPVLGDQTYGGPDKLNGNAIPRQMLHAYKISFTHPSKGGQVNFSASIPKDMEKIMHEYFKNKKIV